MSDASNPFESCHGALMLLAALSERLNPLASPPPSAWNPRHLTADERAALRRMAHKELTAVLPWAVYLHAGREGKLWNSEIRTAWKRQEVRQNGQPYKNPPAPHPVSITNSAFGCLAATDAVFVVAACNSVLPLLNQIETLEQRLAEITGGAPDETQP